MNKGQALSGYLETRPAGALPHDDFTAGYGAGWEAALDTVSALLAYRLKQRQPAGAGAPGRREGDLTISIIPDEQGESHVG